MRDFQKPERSEIFSSDGMIATSHPLAAKIGLDTMSKGGNAIDAAITAALMLVLCEPQSTGLFGDAFAIIKSKKAKGIIGLNGSGKAPMDLTSDSGNYDNSSDLIGYWQWEDTVGGGVGASTVPGGGVADMYINGNSDIVVF